MQTESDKLANDIKVCQQKTTAEYEQMALLCRQASDRQKKIEAIDLELSEIANELATRTDIEQQKAQLQSDLEQKNRTISEYVAALNQMKSEVEELVEVIEVLKQPRSNCPVCESDLSGDRQARVRERQEKKRADILSRMSEIKKRGVIVRSERDTVQEQLKEIEKTLNNLTGLHEKSKQLRIQREELKEQNRLRVEWEAQARKLKEMLDKEEYGAEERARLRVLKLERDKLKAQEQEYQDAQRSVALLTERQVERRHTQLEEAERCHSQRIETHSQLQAKLKQRLERISEERKQQEMLRQELIEIPVIQSEKRQAEQQFRESAKEKEQTQSEVIRLQKALEDCEKARTQLTQKRSERDRLAREKQAYTDLAAAFGKKGIQAHIIENALPEIEAEANRLLSRMTDNAMQVTLSTLRQGRTTGQQIETLDIAITDDAGTRPYEMYSGGEAFRVNFALRIALSRILTRRAGASLQTLILDEGFGTQDIKGRDRLVEAIQSVKEEFSLILVISHIEALKDAFPTRIEIIKTPLGSQINYLE
jgi:exonuclease SbcC